MDNTLTTTIEVTIAGRSFPIKTTEEEQSVIRRIEKELNQRIQEFQLKYRDKDKLDCVIMTLITTAFEEKEQRVTDDDKVIIEEKLTGLESLLEEV